MAGCGPPHAGQRWRSAVAYRCGCGCGSAGPAGGMPRLQAALPAALRAAATGTLTVVCNAPRVHSLAAAPAPRRGGSTTTCPCRIMRAPAAAATSSSGTLRGGTPLPPHRSFPITFYLPPAFSCACKPSVRAAGHTPDLQRKLSTLEDRQAAHSAAAVGKRGSARGGHAARAMRRIALLGVLVGLLVLVAQARSQPPQGRSLSTLPGWLSWLGQREERPRRTLLASDTQEAFQVGDPAWGRAGAGAGRRRQQRVGRGRMLGQALRGLPPRAWGAPGHPPCCAATPLPQVAITCDQPGPATSSPLPLWTVDFGRPLQQANPLALFRVSGVYRWGGAARLAGQQLALLCLLHQQGLCAAGRAAASERRPPRALPRCWVP